MQHNLLDSSVDRKQQGIRVVDWSRQRATAVADASSTQYPQKMYTQGTTSVCTILICLTAVPEVYCEMAR